MVYLTLAIFPAALIFAALNDIYEFKIPNWISLLLLAAFPLALLITRGPIELLWQGYLLGAAMLVIGFILFAFKITGGGDAKLLASATPWIGLQALAEFNFVMAIAGGALSVFLLVFRGLPILPFYARLSWLLELHQTKKGIPYGVAIAIGGIAAFPHSAIFTSFFTG